MHKEKDLRGAFGVEVVKMRKSCGLSAEEFAAKLGVSLNTVYRWENRKTLPAPRAWGALMRFCVENKTDATLLSEAYKYTVVNPPTKGKNNG